MIEREPGAKILSSSFGAVLDILGWQYAKEGDKACDFASSLDALGVTYSLLRSPRGSFEVTNKQSRIEKICDSLSSIESAGTVTSAQASELQGLLNFACSFFCAKAVRQLVSAFSPLADNSRPKTRDRLKSLCRYARAIITYLGPRTHNANDANSPILVFTDGAFDDENASAGAVVVDASTGEGIGFDVEVPGQLLAKWLEHADQVISQIELWAFVAVKWHVRHSWKNRRVIAWIDNEAARISLIKSSSHSPSMAAMCQVSCDMEVKHPLMLWVERVPSHSNPADKPSRNQVKVAVESLGLSIAPALRSDLELVNAVLGATQHPLTVSPRTGAKSEKQSK
eukprot:Skav203546  [mRNA]  locus=scaffold220:186544:187563:+ [translate_table: standard]